MEEETRFEPIGGRFRKRTLAYLVLFLLLIGFLIIWFNRINIADNFVKSELSNRNIEASYEIDDIGFSKQTIRNLVLGDPERPDLTAELVEVGNSLSVEGAGVNWVRAKGVKLYGRLVDGKLSFGELDKFMDPNDDSPLALPDIWLNLEDGQARIDAEFGALGIALSGDGHLHNSFKGELAATSRELSLGGCDLAEPSYFGEISINRRRPTFKGPLRLPGLDCKNRPVGAEDMAAQISVTLGEDLASWEGDAGIIGGPLRYQSYVTQEVKSTVRFKGDSKQTSGDVELAMSGLNSPFGRADTGRMSGPFALGYGGAQMTASFEGQPAVRSAQLHSSVLEQLSAFASSTAGSPLGPIAAKLASAGRSAGGALDMSGDVAFKTGAAGPTFAIDSFDATSRSGAALTLSDPILLGFTDKNIRILAEGSVRLQGGGFPDVRVILDDGSLSRGFSGQLEMVAYEAGSARLNIPALRFSPARGGGTEIDGRMILTGPLPDGRITGLQVPISGSLGRRGGFTLFRQCVDLQFASLRMAALTAGPTRTRLCPAGQAIVSSGSGGTKVAANTPSLRLNGSIGGTPLSINSGAMDISMRGGLRARNVAVRLGSGESQSRFDMALLTAAFGRTISGKITGGDGKVANVPLLLEEVEGDWRYEGGAFLANADLRVRDEQQVERFRPMISKDVALKFANNRITAEGYLLEPTTERKVTLVNMVHRLGNNSGEASLDVGRLTFDDELQPEMLTPLTLGMIANVQGTVTGSGQINWDLNKDGIQSGGTFRTDSINLAAAFGPVTGLSGEITFSDLLGLETGPGQIVRMAEVNPGVAAFNGLLNYRLLPDYKMEIEGGQWPFAGGVLYLEPAILDLGEEAERRLEFTVVGVDAAQFLTQFEFENLSATGTFDGKLPMVFDQDGGRIAGGYLVAREGGGSLAYIGELTYEDMGTMANFAFNALKSLKYNELTIGMDGDIAGEIITEVKFAGLQQGDDASRNFITNQLARIPVEFNVRIQAPFMQLMSSAKAYYEPEILVGQNLPALLRAQEARASEAAKEIKK